MTVQPIRPAAHQPPAAELHSIEAEESALGAAMLDAGARDLVLATLREEDFHRPAHRVIYATIARLAHHSEPVDPVAVTADLNRQGQLCEVGGAPFVHTLVASVPTVAHAGHYIRIVGRLSQLRRLHDMAVRIAALANSHHDPDRILTIAQGLVEDITARAARAGRRPEELLDALTQRDTHAATRPPVSWGIDAIDALGPLAPGQVTLVRASPVGLASRLAIQVAVHNARRVHVLYVTYRLRAAELGQHILATLAAIPLQHAAAVPTADAPESAARRLDVTVYDHMPDALQLPAQVAGLHAQRRIGLVVIDAAHQIPLPTTGRPVATPREAGEIARTLATIAKRCDLPVLACTPRPDDAHPCGCGRPGSWTPLLDNADQVLTLDQPAPDTTAIEATLSGQHLDLTRTLRRHWQPEGTVFEGLPSRRSASGPGSLG